MLKKIARIRRAKTTRCHIRDLGVARLSVLRSGQHIYAQVFTSDVPPCWLRLRLCKLASKMA